MQTNRQIAFTDVQADPLKPECKDVLSKQTTLKSVSEESIRVCTLKKILHRPNTGPCNAERKDIAGHEIRYDIKNFRVSFRDEVLKKPLHDVMEIESHKKPIKHNPCEACIII
jgi:hypothetical protein